jgi:hypothetical protein
MLLKGYCSCPKRLNEHALPLPRYLKNTLGSITYFLTCERVLHSPTKTYKELIPSLGYSIMKHHGSTLLEGYCSFSKPHNTPIIPLGYPINTLSSIT